MRQILGILVATTVLPFAAGCGSGSGTAGEPESTVSATPSSSPSSSPGSSASASDLPLVEPEVVAILSRSAAGGHTSDTAVDVGTPAGMRRLVGGLRLSALADEVRSTADQTAVPDGRRLMGQVVSVGCDVPSDVTVTDDEHGVHLAPVFTGKTLQECLVAVTSIALVLVDAPA